VAEEASPEFPQRSKKWSKAKREHFFGHRKVGKAGTAHLPQAP
jgi:hypothetical protein